MLRARRGNVEQPQALGLLARILARLDEAVLEIVLGSGSARLGQGDHAHAACAGVGLEDQRRLLGARSGRTETRNDDRIELETLGLVDRHDDKPDRWIGVRARLELG